MKKAEEEEEERPGFVGPDKPLGRLTHERAIIITVNYYVTNVITKAPMDEENRKFIEKCIALVCGVAFVAALLVLAVVIPNPTPDQRLTFRIVMAIAAAGFVAMTPGFFEVNISKWIRAGGALAVFVVVFFYNPASLTP